MGIVVGKDDHAVPLLLISVGDPQYLDADPYPDFHFNADLDPIFYLNADPDTNPTLLLTFVPVLIWPFNAPRLPPFYFDSDPGPSFHCDADPDPAF